MNKSALSESDICDKFVRPAMERAGWHGLEQIYREYPLRAGRVVVPFCFSSNSDGFVFRDATLADGVLELTLTLEEFPSSAPEPRRQGTRLHKCLASLLGRAVPQSGYRPVVFRSVGKANDQPCFDQHD